MCPTRVSLLCYNTGPRLDKESVNCSTASGWRPTALNALHLCDVAKASRVLVTRCRAAATPPQRSTQLLQPADKMCADERLSHTQ